MYPYPIESNGSVAFFVPTYLDATDPTILDKRNSLYQ